MKNKKTEWIIFVMFCCLVFFLRLPSFFLSVIDTDESLYLLMAESLADGYLPYTTIWDNKPIGIYVLFYLALIFLGNSVLSIRIAACIAVSITCYFLYRLGNIVGKNEQIIGLLAGILYAIISLGSGGIASNTEIFFAPFVVFAFYLLFSAEVYPNHPTRQSKLRIFTIGLAMGVGLQIKQVVIFEFIALLLIVGIEQYFRGLNGRRRPLQELFKCYVLLFIGFIIPFVCVLVYFLLTDSLHDYIYANFSANLVRFASEGSSISKFVKGFLLQAESNFLLWLCLFLTPLYWISLKGNNSEEKINLAYLLIWLFMAFLGVCAPKSFYSHYFLQLLPPLCLLSSYIIVRTVWTRGIDTTSKVLGLSLVLVTPLFSVAYPYLKGVVKSVDFQYIKGINVGGDGPAIISKYLQERVSQADYIYVVDYQPIIYYLVAAKAPTKYVYPPFLVSPLSKVAGINPLQELDSIMKKNPTYVIKVSSKEKQSSPFYAKLDKYLKTEY